MVTLLTTCREDFFIESGNQYLYRLINVPPEFFKYRFAQFVSYYEYMISLIERSIGAKAEICYGDPERDTVVVLRSNDPYEALMLALHLDIMKFYMYGEKICSVPSISSLEIYEYGFRSVMQDIPSIERLLSDTRYLVIIDARRHGGSVRALFRELRRNGIEPEDSILLTFYGLGEAIYESLGAYVLRLKGYLVCHQACISHLLPPPYAQLGVPDLEMVLVGEKGYFMYELKLLKELGKEVKLRPSLVAVGEVKGSKTDFGNGLHQLMGYLNSGLYNEGYLIIPIATDKISEIRKRRVGLVTWDEKGYPHFIKSDTSWGKDGVEAFKEITNSILNSMQLYINIKIE